MKKVNLIEAGNPDGILRLGPSPLKDSENWTQENSDILAHFIQVNNQISKSSWNKVKCSFKTCGGILVDKQFPTIESFVYVSLYFRQLYADCLFKNTYEIYTQFVDAGVKIAWITDEYEKFKKCLDAQSKPFVNISHKKIIEAFFYGVLLFHSPTERNKKTRDLFKSLISNHTKEELLFSANAAFRELFNHVSAIAPVVYQDFAHWQNQYNIPAPDIFWQESIFGG